MKKAIIGLICALFAYFSATAQSSEEISKIIKSEKATFAQVSYLPALYANLISGDEGSETNLEQTAFDALNQKGYLPAKATAESEVTLGQLCYIYAKAFDIKGGLFYTLFPSERYAFKEFKAKGFLPSTADPSMALSGRDSLDLFNSCLEMSGGNE